MQVTLYSKQNCQQCRATKFKLDQLGIEYEYVEDVTTDVDLVESLKARAAELGVAGGMPYVSIYDNENNLIIDWFGFQPVLIDHHLAPKG